MKKTALIYQEARFVCAWRAKGDRQGLSEFTFDTPERHCGAILRTVYLRFKLQRLVRTLLLYFIPLYLCKENGVDLSRSVVRVCLECQMRSLGAVKVHFEHL